MALSSMTGFARSHGTSGPYAFEWELKSVNAKGFDFRMRLPAGWDDVELAARKRATELLSRGTVYANLTVRRTNTASVIRINPDVLNAVLKIAAELAGRIDAVAPSIDGLMGIKGVVEVAEPEADEAEEQAARIAVSAAFEVALHSLVEMRKREGATLGDILTQRLNESEKLAGKAEAAPGRKPEAIRARLAEQIATLLEASDRFDSDRLTHWEEGGRLLEPHYPWELVQIGNCGPPIELDEGWLLLTHGVGAMRKYSVGAVLLDKDDPSKVIGRTAEPILAAKDQDREGYVPNVVYSCGAIRHGDSLFLPYGVADSSVAFAFVPIKALVATLA